MARAALVVTHGGHGTMMRALKYGLPMLVMPGMAADQAPNAAVVEEIGAGRSLSQDASVEAIRTAAADVLESPAFGMKAREIARQMAGMDGSLGAALEIEALLASSAAARRAMG